jgi:hypothetical protein
LLLIVELVTLDTKYRYEGSRTPLALRSLGVVDDRFVPFFIRA